MKERCTLSMSAPQMRMIVATVIILLIANSCDGVPVKKLVSREVRKQVKGLEEKLVDKINDACQIQACASVYYRGCQDALDGGNVFSGQYMIQPDNGNPFLVYCDMDQADGNGWVVFQRRFDGSVNFYRNWTDYVQGFGHIDGEFWLGLDKIHRLTNRTSPTKLRIELKDYGNSGEAFADYSEFIVESAENKYKLSVIFSNGTAGDSLSDHHNMMKFSTPDMDNDNWSVFHCAQQSRGAWWYNMCHDSNLNGLYSATVMYGTEYARWRTWKGAQSLKGTVMKLN